MQFAWGEGEVLKQTTPRHPPPASPSCSFGSQSEFCFATRLNASTFSTVHLPERGPSLPVVLPPNLVALHPGTLRQIEAIKRIDKSPMHSLGGKLSESPS